MSRKRSKYRPRAALINTMEYVMVNCRKIADIDHKIEYQDGNHVWDVLSASLTSTKMHDAMNNIVKGVGNEHDVSVLVKCVNMAQALTLVNKNLGMDWFDDIIEAQTAMFNIMTRGQMGKKFLFTGEEMAKVNHFLDIHDSQLESVTVGELRKAHVIIDEYRRNGKMIKPMVKAKNEISTPS